MVCKIVHERKRNPISDQDKIVRRGRYPNAIARANFGDGLLRGFWVFVGQISPFPIGFRCRLYNSLACNTACKGCCSKMWNLNNVCKYFVSHGFICVVIWACFNLLRELSFFRKFPDHYHATFVNVQWKHLNFCQISAHFVKHVMNGITENI